MPGNTSSAYLSTEAFHTDKTDVFHNLSRRKHLKIINKATNFVLKPLSSHALYRFHCADKNDLFQHIHPVLTAYVGYVPEVKEILVIKQK